jgi:hypothetical protein
LWTYNPTAVFLTSGLKGKPSEDGWKIPSIIATSSPIRGKLYTENSATEAEIVEKRI